MTKNTPPDPAVVQGIGQRIFSYIKFIFNHVCYLNNRFFCLKKDVVVRRCSSGAVPHFENLNWTGHTLGTHAVRSCEMFSVHVSVFLSICLFVHLSGVFFLNCSENFFDFFVKIGCHLTQKVTESDFLKKKNKNKNKNNLLVVYVMLTVL